jgi:two-component system sensor kinase
LQAANRDLESFSYTVSHDLRAPLRAVDGYARILEEDYAGALDAEGLRLLSVVRSEARRMGTLIDDLLAFSRFGRQSLASSPIDLRPLGEEIMRDVRSRKADRTIDFVCADLPPALADQTTLRQVLVNLLTNAVKYAKPEGDIRIELGGQRDEVHNIYWVRDNGIGFDMRYAEKIFGVFQRLHNDQQFEGTGVGLAIVERIITRHGGRVWAESEPGKGATFFFSLPAADDQRAEISQHREAVNE